MDKDGERMTNEEAIKGLKNVSTMFTGYKPNEEMFAMAIKALEQQEKTAAITRYTDGLEEGIRCAMCTNPMANDRGCDGGCVVNESMYQNVLNVIKKQILEQEPCEDCISRQDALNCVTFNEFRYRIVEDIKALPSVTPKKKTAAWVPIDAEPNDIHECNACGWLLYYEDTTDFKYCPNCGARMVEPQENNNVNCKTTKCKNCTNHNYCDYEQQEKSEYEHDHEVVKAYNDGQAYILDKIRAEIEQGSCKVENDYDKGRNMGLHIAMQIIDKYRGE